MLAVTAKTAHHILSAGAPSVAPDERWYRTGPLSSGVIVLIDLVTDQPPVCCSLFCLPAFLAWCNWQRMYWSGNYCNTWDGLGQGGSGWETRVCVLCCGDMKMIRYWQGTAPPFTRKPNHTAITHPPSTGYPADIRKTPEFTGNMSKLIPVSLHLNYLFISASSDLLVHLGIDLNWSMQSQAQWRKGHCRPTKRSIRQESIVRPLIAWCLRKLFALLESLSLSGCSEFRCSGSFSSI